MKNRLLEYSILRGKSEESDEKLEGKIGPVMEVHMDANRTLSQLSYEPVWTFPGRPARSSFAAESPPVRALHRSAVSPLGGG